MTAAVHDENPFAGQGSVLLDIGGDVGALIVTMPPDLEGMEVEIAPEADLGHDAERHEGHEAAHEGGHDHDHHGGHAHGHPHRPHVAVVNRPVQGDRVPSLVFPELVEGRYGLYEKGTTDVHLVVDVRGGEVATAAW